MPVLTFSQNGASVAGSGNASPTGGKRGKVVGWSAGAARRNTKFLQSIEVDALSGVGDAVTLTLRDTPPTADQWCELVQKLLRRVRQMPDSLRWHWIVEWQRRGAPHLHLAVYSSADNAHSGRGIGDAVAVAWLEIASEFAAGRRSQFVTPITGPTGWLKYLSKHAARGVGHYQRQGSPTGWDRTGRLWGYGGDWPVIAWEAALLSPGQAVRARRMVQHYLVAQARADALRAGEHRRRMVRRSGAEVEMDAVERAAWDRVAYLRRVRKCAEPQLSAVRGLSGWVPLAVSAQILGAVEWDGSLRVKPL